MPITPLLKRLSLAPLLPALICGLVTAAAQADATDTPAVTVHIDTKQDYGQWQGWGASLAWMGNVFGDRADIADLFFTDKTVHIAGTELPGLQLNIVRYNAGACSWNTIAGDRRMVVSDIILPFRQIEGYWLAPRDPDPMSSAWDWFVDAKQRQMLQMARDRGADRFELFSNAPMWWMCQNDNPSGAAKASDNNLSPDHYADFAYYLATIARHAKDEWGINFTTVSPFNEPSSKWWHENGKQEGCHVSPTEQMKILPLVRAAFDAQGLSNIDLVASDESFYDQAIATWKAFTPEVKAIVDQVNVHGYQGANGRRDELYRITHLEDGKTLWNSEHGDGDASGLELARDLNLDFQWLHPTAWAYWQPIDGGREGKGGSGWGLLDSRMLDGTRLKANPKYYVVAQYTRHIRPGMTIYLGDDPRTVFALDRTARKAVIVAYNDRNTPADYTFDLSQLADQIHVSGIWLTQPNELVLYSQVPLPPAQTRTTELTIAFPSKSIQTIELDWR